MADELVKKFVDLQAETEQFLNQDKYKEARQKYLDVVKAYHDIHKSNLDGFHKELAYTQVNTLFRKVNIAKERVKIPYNLIAAAFLIMAFSFVIFLKPSIVGLAGYDDIMRTKVDLTFTESSVESVSLRERPLSLSVSGEFTGEMKLYLKEGEKVELIFDSSKHEEGTFRDVCEDTCEVNVRSNAVSLFADVESGELHLTEVSYRVQRKSNTAPVWTGDVRTFIAEVGETKVIDLTDYFSDPDGNSLVFLSTTEAGLEITVEQSIVKITPQSAGTKEVVFIASDLREVTRVPVTIEIE